MSARKYAWCCFEWEVGVISALCHVCILLVSGVIGARRGGGINGNVPSYYDR